ncbi:reverse transcriptase domain-containing protein [Tanacetum coccineum]
MNGDGLFMNKLPSDKALFMVRQVTNDEIKDAIFNIGNDKAPGPDGFTSVFFKKAWDNVGEDVCNAVKDFFSNGHILREINHTIIALLPKAFDTVSWKFLKDILMGFGFHDTMIKWIMACISSTSYSINVNGELHGYFKGKRGLRQGDPISPYLFIVVMEILTLMLKRRVRESGDFGYHNRCSKQKIINICFVDYLIMFSRGDIQSAKILIEALEEFKCASGLVPSILKSTIFFCNVVAHVKTAILQLMPFEEGSLPIKYLGVPLISSRLAHTDCKILVERVQKWIGDWKNKWLSFAGRLQLCLSVVSSMHVYWASVFILLIVHHLSYQAIHNARFSIHDKVADLILDNAWSWPADWNTMYPPLANVNVPHLNELADTFYPRHAAHYWLGHEVYTIDHLRPWDVEKIGLNFPSLPFVKVEQDTMSGGEWAIFVQ